MNEDGTRWPYGTGGNCGPEFAATHARCLADLRELGIRGALEHWVRTGQIGPTVLEVLTEADYAAMERAWVAEGSHCEG